MKAKMKTKIIILSVLVTIGLVVLPSATVAAGPTIPPTKTTVSFVPSQVQGACEPWAPSYDYDIANTIWLNNITTHTISDSPTEFTVQFTLLKNLCSPFTAKAAVYDLPGTPWPWPQTLYSVFAFVVQDSGTYTVTFSKTCAAQQFDVLTGATPKNIDIGGTYHGPLLYPLESGLIWPGSVCVDNSTTTTSTTSTSTTSTSTTSTSTTSTSTTTTTEPVTTTSTTTTTQPVTTSTTTTTEPVTTTSTTTTSTTEPSTTTTTTTQPTTTTTDATTTSGPSTTVLGTVVTRPPSCNNGAPLALGIQDIQSAQIQAVTCDPTDPSDPSTPTTVTVQVAGISVSNTLPVTGSETYVMVGIASVLIGSGALFLIASRRRRLLVK